MASTPAFGRFLINLILFGILLCTPLFTTVARAQPLPQRQKAELESEQEFEECEDQLESATPLRVRIADAESRLEIPSLTAQDLKERLVRADRKTLLEMDREGVFDHWDSLPTGEYVTLPSKASFVKVDSFGARVPTFLLNGKKFVLSALQTAQATPYRTNPRLRLKSRVIEKVALTKKTLGRARTWISAQRANIIGTAVVLGVVGGIAEGIHFTVLHDSAQIAAQDEILRQKALNSNPATVEILNDNVAPEVKLDALVNSLAARAQAHEKISADEFTYILEKLPEGINVSLGKELDATYKDMETRGYTTGWQRTYLTTDLEILQLITNSLDFSRLSHEERTTLYNLAMTKIVRTSANYAVKVQEQTALEPRPAYDNALSAYFYQIIVVRP